MHFLSIAQLKGDKVRNDKNISIDQFSKWTPQAVKAVVCDETCLSTLKVKLKRKLLLMKYVQLIMLT